MVKMTRILFFIRITLVVIALPHDVKADDDPCVRLTAAFNYDGDVYLVSGNDYYLLDSDMKEIDHGTLENDFRAPGGEIDAALMFDGTLYFFQEGYYYSYDYMYFFGSSNAANHNWNWDEFFEPYLDAAATLGDTSYFFNGCEYAKGNGDYVVGSLKDLGLPCHVDAAWNYDGQIYVTLENDVWFIDEDGEVTGPERLSDYVTLTTNSICPNDPFEEKIRAEQNYERENECTIIDAAITWRDTVYLFNDDEYITLDDDGNEIEKAGIYEWGLLPPNIDAGVVWSGNGATYFFKGEYYYRYSYSFFNNIAFGPLSSSEWGPFFSQGIDAAGNHNGTTYFFKGCDTPVIEAGTTTNSSGHNLPCDADAAFSRGDTLYVIKWNQVWTWQADKDVTDDPVSLSTVVNITSWTPCPVDDD